VNKYVVTILMDSPSDKVTLEAKLNQLLVSANAHFTLIAVQDDKPRMPFGKYAGQRLDEVPAEYLDWLDGEESIRMYPEVAAFIRDNRGWINRELEHPPPGG
jgi:hypothetical protein